MLGCLQPGAEIGADAGGQFADGGIQAEGILRFDEAQEGARSRAIGEMSPLAVLAEIKIGEESFNRLLD